MVLGKAVLKIWQIYRRAPVLKFDFNKVASNFIEITLWQGCSPVNLLLHFFRSPFPRNLKIIHVGLPDYRLLDTDQRIYMFMFNREKISCALHPTEKKVLNSFSRKCSVRKVFLKIFQNTQGNSCASVSFLIKKS